VRFGLPDVVLAMPGQQRSPDVRMTHETPTESVFLQVRGGGSFVRSLLPVRLTGGHTVRFGVWLEVGADQQRHAASVWWEPDYLDLRLNGWLANALPGWGLLDAPVVATVRTQDESPYCTSSPDPELSRVLSDEWDHEAVLPLLPPL
jgi:hypothetical protein